MTARAVGRERMRERESEYDRSELRTRDAKQRTDEPISQAQSSCLVALKYIFYYFNKRLNSLWAYLNSHINSKYYWLFYLILSHISRDLHSKLIWIYNYNLFSFTFLADYLFYYLYLSLLCEHFLHNYAALRACAVQPNDADKWKQCCPCALTKPSNCKGKLNVEQERERERERAIWWMVGSEPKGAWERAMREAEEAQIKWTNKCAAIA